MTEQKPFPPKLLKGRMYEKKTKTGETFYAGTDGYLKTYMFKDNKNSTGEDNVWLVYVVPRSEEEIAQRREQNAAKYGVQPTSPAGTYGSAPPQRNTQPLNNGPDDWIPF
jgi:hypothetical protein